jgi:hypothetical protein
MQSTLSALLGPLGFAETSTQSFLRTSRDGHVRHLVAPFHYPSGQVTVEIGFLCPALTACALPDVDVYDPPDLALCDAGLGFSFRLEALLEEPGFEGWDEPEALVHVHEHLVAHVRRLSLLYGNLIGWGEHYDERLEKWGGAMDWASWAWVQLLLSAEAASVGGAIRSFATAGRGRFPDDLLRLRVAYEERYGEELSLGAAEEPFRL